MKQTKQYGKLVAYYLLFSLASYLLTSKVVNRLPDLIKDSVITFVTFLVFNFLLIPISATKEVLIKQNKYNKKILTTTTLISIAIIFILFALVKNTPSQLPYSLVSADKYELADQIEFIEQKTNQNSIEYLFHKRLKLVSNNNQQSIFCTPDLYKLNTSKLELYFPYPQDTKFVSEAIKNNPDYYSIVICRSFSNSLYVAITTDTAPQNNTVLTNNNSQVFIFNSLTKKYSKDTIILDSTCRYENYIDSNFLYVKCNNENYDTTNFLDVSTLYQIDTAKNTAKKIYICTKTKLRETCVDQNQVKYYDKISRIP